MNIEDVRILLVEDDPLMRTYTANTLRRLGIKSIQECVNGAEALETVVGFQPDLILSDIHMKPMDGLEFVKGLRALPNPDVQRTKVIFMSADSSQETLRAALPLGVIGYIVKPPKLEYLKTKIEAALKSR